MGRSWRDELDAPDEIRDQLPRGYDLVGHVAILHLIDPLEAIDPDPGFPAAVGEALIDGVPPARTAAIDHGVEGELRTRRIQLLAGDPDLVADHKENGCRLLVDLEATYFSPRLAHERARVADQVEDGERALDMYCGVAPYGVLLAKRGADVLAIDINPRAVTLARQNAERNKVPDRIDVLLADAPQTVPTLEDTFDRIVMNLPHSAVDHVDEALTALAEDGQLHLGAMLPKDDAEEEAQAIAAQHDLELVELVSVRPYNPAVGHYTLDLERA